jgi:thiamine-monophosphate kinase
MPSEFELIRRHFTRPAPNAATAALLGVGDDCALLSVPAQHELAVSTDMLVAGVHFLEGARADWLGHKALAVNLSDLAAMGATPRWALLAMALPAADDAWLEAFASGLFALADRFEVELIGGDTTRGPLNICITVGGHVLAGAALRRDAARAGDDIWITGTLGDAALALASLRGEIEIPAADRASIEERLHRPQPRIAAGIALRGVAHSAIDISDGLLADLGHILERSHCGARLELERIPRSAAFSRQAAHPRAMHWMLAGGDDYELCFTAPASARAAIAAISANLELPISMAGRIEQKPGLRIVDAGGKPVGIEVDIAAGGYDHFR